MSTSIDLSSAAPFTLGTLQVNPPTLEVASGERRETLEPRIMQVLVALNRRRGDVVSRDDLIRDCWDGRSVGDDAINRCIARLRRLAETHGGYSIETIPRVGYRLVAEPDEPTAAPEQAAPAGETLQTTPWWKGRSAAIVGALVLLVAVAIVASFRLSRDSEPSSLRHVAVLAFEPLGTTQDLHIFGEAVAEQIIGVLNDNQMQAVSRAQAATLRGPERDSAARKLGADFILDGTVQRGPAGLRVTVHLDRASTHTTLWTSSFDQADQDAADLQSQVAARAVDEIKAALRMADAADDAAISAYLKAQENAREGGRTATALRHDQMRIVVARAPEFSAGQSGLAVSAALLMQFAEGAEVDALRKEAKAAIARALELDPKNGEAYFAKAVLAAPTDYSQQEAIFRKGLAVDPSEPTLNSSLAALMYDVGRWSEALALQQRSVMLDPLSPRKTAALAMLEAQAGNSAQARATIERAAKLWPNNVSVWANRIIILAATGSSKEAMHLLETPQKLPVRPEPGIVTAIRAFLKADAERTPAAVAAAKRELQTALAADRINFESAVWLLARLGDVDGAYALTGQYFTQAGGDRPRSRHDSSALLRPDTANLRRDSRFLPLVERLQLVQYWRSHTAPDFCARETNAVCTSLKAGARH